MNTEGDRRNDDGRSEWLHRLRDRNSQEQLSLAPGLPFFDAAAMGQTFCVAMPGGMVVVNRKCGTPYC